MMVHEFTFARSFRDNERGVYLAENPTSLWSEMTIRRVQRAQSDISLWSSEGMADHSVAVDGIFFTKNTWEQVRKIMQKPNKQIRKITFLNPNVKYDFERKVPFYV